MSAKEKFQAINRDFNDLPRRLLYGFALFAALALFFVLFKYVAPFAIGFAVSLMIEPVVRRITPASPHPFGQDGAALVCVLVVYGVLLYLLSVLLARLVVELQAPYPHVAGMGALRFRDDQRLGAKPGKPGVERHPR